MRQSNSSTSAVMLEPESSLDCHDSVSLKFHCLSFSAVTGSNAGILSACIVKPTSELSIRLNLTTLLVQ